MKDKNKAVKSRIITLFIISILFSLPHLLMGCTPKNPFPFMESGKYQFGTNKNYKFTDISRDNREVSLYIWYPAKLSPDAEITTFNFDAEPDHDNAPYPVILSSFKTGMIFGPHLASHGFVVVGVYGQDSKHNWGQWLIDYPLDQVFALDQLSSNSLAGLDGMIDFKNAGAMGYSFDGYDALALSGARIDPEYYLQQCSDPRPGNPNPEIWWINYICNLDGGWEEFVTHAGPEITESPDGLWKPLTDDRILAVMPMAPEGAWLFGESGLAAVNRPTLIIAATADDINYYDIEAATIFTQLGTSEKTMISFINQDHMMIFDPEQVSLMKHFAVAFFGFYLQAQDAYGSYFTEKYISNQESLAWGIYNGR